MRIYCRKLVFYWMFFSYLTFTESQDLPINKKKVLLFQFSLICRSFFFFAVNKLKSPSAVHVGSLWADNFILSYKYSSLLYKDHVSHCPFHATSFIQEEWSRGVTKISTIMHFFIYEFPLVGENYWKPDKINNLVKSIIVPKLRQQSPHEKPKTEDKHSWFLNFLSCVMR